MTLDVQIGAPWCWLLQRCLSWSFQWTETGNICMYMHMQANRHTKISPRHTDFRNNQFMPLPLMLIYHHRAVSCLLQLDLYIPFSTVRTQASTDIGTLTHLLKPLIHLKYFQNCRKILQETNLLKSGQNLFASLLPSHLPRTEVLQSDSMLPCYLNFLPPPPLHCLLLIFTTNFSLSSFSSSL